MSSSGITPLNSGPLIIRTYNDTVGRQTYLLTDYEYPVAANRILTTSTNGLLLPSDNVYVSSMSVSTINGIPYPPLDDALWSSDGAGNIYNDNSGNVGIGLSTPQYKLDVFGNSLGYGGVRIAQSTSQFSTDDPALQIKNNNVSPYSGIRFFTNLNANNFNPICNTNDKAMVFSDGSINTGNMWIGPWSATEAGIKMLTNGNVGIGLGAPEFKLDVFGNSLGYGSARLTQSTSEFFSSDPALQIRNNNTIIPHYINFFTNLGSGSYNPISDASDKAIVFSNGSINTGNLWIGPWSGTAAGIKILTNGNVGIGLQTPVYTLDVSGIAQVSTLKTNMIDMSAGQITGLSTINGWPYDVISSGTATFINGSVKSGILSPSTLSGTSIIQLSWYNDNSPNCINPRYNISGNDFTKQVWWNISTGNSNYFEIEIGPNGTSIPGTYHLIKWAILKL